jgi:hypothetical protein
VAPLAEESEQPPADEKTFKGTFKYYVEKPSIKVEDRDNTEDKKTEESPSQPWLEFQSFLFITNV